MAIGTFTYSVRESFEDRISYIEFWDNGITCINLKPHVNIEIDDIKTQRLFLSANSRAIQKHLILVETSIDSTISKAAREFAAEPEINSVTKAVAIMVKSLANRIIINFIIKFSRKQTTQMKMFDNKQKAIDWLLSFKKQ
jgi:hypothetical protein